MSGQATDFFDDDGPEPEPAREPELGYGAGDGFRVCQADNELRLQVHLNGKSIAHAPAAFTEDTLAGRMAAQRLLIVLDVVAGFLNVGGQLPELMEMLDRLKNFCPWYQIKLPDGWEPLAWNYDTSADEYVFFNRQQGLVSVVAPEDYSETMSVVEFCNSDDDFDLAELQNSDPNG